MRTAVGVMARAPSSGGKSRLAPHLSPARLAALRAALLADTLLVAARLPDVTIFFTPDEAEHEIAAASPSTLRREPQGAGDLGVRMLRALRHLLDTRPCDAAMLVGSDIPLLSADHVREAAEQLSPGAASLAEAPSARRRVVLGPADDGGYYLIGMPRPGSGHAELYAKLFDGIAWGTETVLTDTLRIAERLGVDTRLARSAYDVDTIDDLRRAERELASEPPAVCPALRRWLSES